MSLNNVEWSNFPAPTDDGGSGQLLGMSLPSLALQSTDFLKWLKT